MPDFDIRKQTIHILNAWGKSLVKDLRKAINDAVKADGGGQSSSLAGDATYQVTDEGGNINFKLFFTGKGKKYWDYADKGVDGTEKSHGSKYKFKKKNLNQKAMLAFIDKRHFKIELTDRRKKRIKAVRTKGIRQQYKKLSILDKKKSLAFILGRSIAKKGLEPMRFMEKVITNERISELKEMLIPVIKEGYILDIKNSFQ